MVRFARSFAEQARQPADVDGPSGVARVSKAGLAVAVIAAGAVGTGVLVAYVGQHRDTASAAAGTTVSKSPQDRAVGGPDTESRRPGASKSPAAAGQPSPGRQDSDGRPTPSPTGGTGSVASGPLPASPRAGSGTGADRTTPGPTGFHIVSSASGRCIDVTDAKTAAGTPLQIWDCSPVTWQTWTFASDGTVRALGRCMAVAGGSADDGAAIGLAACTGSASQRFRLNAAGDLVSVRADKCVDVKDQLSGNGTRLQLWVCGGTANQKWSREK
ncbi:ricin-type beta-trefoil lectin domain protein [Streptomyces shenzhenensis]|uniref:ricin-type beta-trefoil lectin domain protein n=1 Tax=Streptomyces shenzhenensis TaxID=943815 RepID=UPI003D9502DE